MAANQGEPSNPRFRAPKAELERAREVLGAAPDDTLPPTPLRELLAAGGLGVFVLSIDDDLVDVIEQAGGDQYPVTTVDRWSALDDAIHEGRCGVAVLDASFLGGELPPAIARLEQHASKVVTLVAAERSSAQNLLSPLSDGRIHRLLIKPLAVGSARLVLESAVMRGLQLREMDDTSEPAAVSSAGSAARSRRLPVVIAAAISMILAGAITLYWLLQSDPRADSSELAVDVAPVVEETLPAVASDPGNRLLELAARAAAEGRLAEPPGDNALDYYLVALNADPQNTEARARLDALVETLFVRAESALLGGSLDEADRALATLRRTDVTGSRLDFLAVQLERARAAASTQTTTSGAPNRARPSRQSRRSNERDGLLSVGAARLDREQLVEPDGDSAFEYWSRAARLDPNAASVDAFRGRLLTAVLAAAKAALADSNLSSASRLIAAATQLGASPAALDPLTSELGAARAERRAADLARQLTAAIARLQAGAILPPEKDNALTLLSTLQREAPTLGGLAAAWSELRSSVGDAARAAILRGDWEAAETQVAALENVPDSEPLRATLEADLRAGQRQAEYLRVSVPAGELPLKSYSPPQYPSGALQRGLEGWVELEFVVDKSGRPRDIQILAAEPANTFENAATTAVSQYEFEPFTFEGHIYERLARLRIRFDLR